MVPGISSVAVPYLDRSVFDTAVFEGFSYTRSSVEPSNQARNQRFQINLNSVNIIGNSTSKKGISRIFHQIILTSQSQ